MSSIPGNPLPAGTVLAGKISWFGGPHDPSSGPTTASGSPIAAGGIAVYNSATLGGYWRLQFPNGRTVVERQTDLGPAPWTGKTFDVAYSSLAGAGYSESNFPTGAQIKAEYLGKNPDAATLASSSSSPSSSGSAGAASSPSSSSSGGTLLGGISGVEGILVKAMLYLAVIVGGMILLAYGTKSSLGPIKASS